MSAAELYERVKAACCSESGLSPDLLEGHVRAIVEKVLSVRGLLPEEGRR